MPNSNAIAASPVVLRRHCKVDAAPMPAKKGRRLGCDCHSSIIERATDGIL
jgi:hypothetical protein